MFLSNIYVINISDLCDIVCLVFLIDSDIKTNLLLRLK